MLAGQYQWIKGENQGTVENITETIDGWVNFQSGRRIKSDLLQEFMLPIGHAEQVVKIPGVKSDYAFESGDADDMITDPDTGQQISMKQLRLQEKMKRNSTGPIVPGIAVGLENATAEVHVATKQESPITLLISKSKKDKVKVNYEFEIEIPKQDVYNIIDQSFDIELNEEIIAVVLSTIDNKTLKESVEEAINNTIKSYYKSK
jgi:hypothetical protein